MKKNRMMRLASVLLVCVLLTTSVISGTFAKYVTAETGEDSARVAEWGVAIEVNGADSMFKTSYTTDENPAVTDEGNQAISVTVDGESDDVVAPGTAGSMTFSITGKPEVAAEVDVDFGTVTMIEVPANKIVVDEDKGTLNEVYHPIKWTLKRNNATVEDWSAVTAELSGVTLEEIKAYFTGAAGKNGNYAPNTDLATVFGYYQLSWTWDYDVDDDDACDLLDTYLGNQQAADNKDSDVVLKESFDLSITVTQID